MPYHFRITYVREGRERHVTPAFRDPADAQTWAEKIYGTSLLAIEPAVSPNRQRVLELVLEEPSTEERV